MAWSSGQKGEPVFADLYLITVGKLGRFDSVAVEEGSVEASLILKEKT